MIHPEKLISLKFFNPHFSLKLIINNIFLKEKLIIITGVN